MSSFVWDKEGWLALPIYSLTVLIIYTKFKEWKDINSFTCTAMMLDLSAEVGKRLEEWVKKGRRHFVQAMGMRCLNNPDKSMEISVMWIYIIVIRKKMLQNEERLGNRWYRKVSNTTKKVQYICIKEKTYKAWYPNKACKLDQGK